VSLRAWIDKLTGRRPAAVESTPLPDPYDPPLPELTPDEEEARAVKQRKVLDKQDKEDGGGDEFGNDRYVTP
jgi:hypothetical protein